MKDRKVGYLGRAPAKNAQRFLKSSREKSSSHEIMSAHALYLLLSLFALGFAWQRFLAQVSIFPGRQRSLLVNGCFSAYEVCELPHCGNVGFPPTKACQTCVNCSWFVISPLNLTTAHICTSCCSLRLTSFQRKHELRPKAGASRNYFNEHDLLLLLLQSWNSFCNQYQRKWAEMEVIWKFAFSVPSKRKRKRRQFQDFPCQGLSSWFM